MIILGFIAAIIIGFTLGLIGGGGSILAVPVFVYLFGIDPVLATGYSLFVVGISSAVGSINYMKAGLLNYRAAIVFAVPSLFAVFATRKFLMPSIPDKIISIGNLDFTFNHLIILVFIILMMIGLVVFIRQIRTKDIRFYRVIWLAVPAIIMVFLMRQFIIPSIPETLFSLNGFVLTKNAAVMVFFSIIMFASSFSMIKRKKNPKPKQEVDDIKTKFNYPVIVAEGAVVGTITGIVGAGGGFLIIPALVLLAKLPMKLAVGTSLLIIATKSLIGFLGDVSRQEIDWSFLTIFTGLAVLGIFVGTYASKYISGEKLKKSFGWFVLIMAVYIMFRELM